MTTGRKTSYFKMIGAIGVAFMRPRSCDIMADAFAADLSTVCFSGLVSLS